MKSSTSGRLLVAGALLTGLFTFAATAQDTPATQPTTAATPSTELKGDAPKPAAAATAPVSGIADVLKMLDAGVSKDVVKAYIENSPTAYNLTSADVIALKERAVNDDITMMLLKRTAETRAQPVQTAQAVAAAPAQPAADSGRRVVRYLNSANLNPESEDYFQYYYLYPRTLASTYQTLGVQPYSYPYYGGYYPSMSFGPRYGPAYGQPRRYFRH